MSPLPFFSEFYGISDCSDCSLYWVLPSQGEYKSTKLLDKRCWSKQLYILSLLSIITLPHIYVLESEVLVHKMSSAS